MSEHWEAKDGIQGLCVNVCSNEDGRYARERKGTELGLKRRRDRNV